MILNGKAVLNYLRVSPKLLVCGLEGNDTYEIRGDKAYVDAQESAISTALKGGRSMTFNSANPMDELLQRLAAMTPPDDEVLPMPTYCFGAEDKQATEVHNSGSDIEELPMPVYDFSRFK
jgi:hypothetical protein